jgi:hypothetical protein
MKKEMIYLSHTLSQPGDVVALSSSFESSFGNLKTFCRLTYLTLFFSFAKCDVCVNFREERAGTADVTKLERIKKKLSEHLKFVKAERSSYHSRRRKAMDNPKHRLSIILDGTSQAEYYVPRFAQATKTTCAAHKLKTHFVGVIAHGIGAFIYGLHDDWKHDSNLTIEILHRALSQIEASGFELPPVLDLQMDNCARENKNRYVLRFFRRIHFFICLQLCSRMAVPPRVSKSFY